MKPGTLGPPTSRATPFLPVPTTLLLTLAQTVATQTILLWVAVALVVTAVVLLIGVAVSVFRRSRASRLDDLPPPMATGAVPEAERLLRLMGEAEELAARLTAQLDDKARHLEHLLRQADVRAASLERRPATPISPAAHPITPSSAPHTPHAPLTPPHATDPRVITRPINLATTIHAPSPVAALTGHAAAVARPANTPGPTQPLPTQTAIEGASDPIVTAICQLADQGKAAPAIAQQLGQPIGKVELILALRSA